MNLKEMNQHPVGYILKYSIPAIIAMVLTSMVTVIDGIFISNSVGKEALAAMNLGLPILYVYLAVGIMIGVGGVSIAGRRLGQQCVDQSINGFNQTCITGLMSFLVLSMILFLGLKPILFSTKLDVQTIETMLSYYDIMIWIYPFMMLNVIFGMFLRGEGKHNLFMINTLITTTVNIILDYLFIVVFKWGIAGAAVGSAIAVLIGFCLMIGYFLNKKTLFGFRKFHFESKDLTQTLYNGSSELIGQLSLSITMFFLNYVVLKRMGLLGVAGLTIIGYSRYIFNMIIIGFGQGISPMISYSYGAKAYNVGEQLRKKTNQFVFGVGLIFFVVLFFGGHYYTRLFTQDAVLSSLVIHGLKLFSFGFLFTGYNVISSFYFTGIGYAKESAIISSMRGLILLSLNILILPMLLGNNGIWLIGLFTEGLTCLITIQLLKSSKEKIAMKVA